MAVVIGVVHHALLLPLMEGARAGDVEPTHLFGLLVVGVQDGALGVGPHRPDRLLLREAPVDVMVPQVEDGPEVRIARAAGDLEREAIPLALDVDRAEGRAARLALLVDLTRCAMLQVVHVPVVPHAAHCVKQHPFDRLVTAFRIGHEHIVVGVHPLLLQCNRDGFAPLGRRELALLSGGLRRAAATHVDKQGTRCVNYCRPSQSRRRALIVHARNR